MNVIPRKPYRILTGDAREVLRTLPDESAHCVVTSPPYWGLRDYGTEPQAWGGDSDCAHEWKIKTRKGQSGEHSDIQDGNAGSYFDSMTYAFCQKCGAWRGSLGLEPTIDFYIKHIVKVFREVRRVLRADGTLWLNMGDCYAAGCMTGRTGPNSTISAKGQQDTYLPARKPPAGLKPKDLVGQPWRVAFALQADGWWLRSDIIWHKTNPTPESCRDRPTKSHEYIFLLTKSAKYFFDQEAVREDHATPVAQRQFKAGRKCLRGQETIRPRGNLEVCSDAAARYYAKGGRNIRSVWTIPTQPFPEAHFATFPEALPERCIRAGTSERGCCPECGAPWVRMIEKTGGTPDPARGWDTGPGAHGREKRRGDRAPKHPQGDHESVSGRIISNVAVARAAGGEHDNPFPARATIGWQPSCEHEADPVPCVVLDPFVGSGTTALVAVRLGRRAVGIDLSAEYTGMVKQQLAVAVLGGSRRPRKFRLKRRRRLGGKRT